MEQDLKIERKIHESCLFLCDITGDIISRDRFEAIKSNFYLVDNLLLNENRSDKFSKIRPMIDHLRNKFKSSPKSKSLV